MVNALLKTSLFYKNLLRRNAIFWITFSVVLVLWSLFDGRFFGANGWFIDLLFSFLVTLHFWNTKSTKAKQQSQG